MAIVYRHIRLDKNEPFYIGIGNSKYRATKKDNRNEIWQNIVSKTDYKVEIIFDDLTWDEACEKEKEFISLYGRIKDGGILANITFGGEGVVGLQQSENSKEKARQLMLKNTKDPIFMDKVKKAASVNGKKQSQNKELRQKLMDASNAARRKTVFSLYNGELKEWISISEAGRYFDISSSDIIRCCKLGYKRKGIQFSYTTEFIINNNCKNKII
jgi:hypothetical protein